MIYDYILFYYLTFIKEDFDDYKRWALVFIKPAWFAKSILKWVLSPLVFALFYLYKINEKKINKIRKEIEEEINQ